MPVPLTHSVNSRFSGNHSVIFVDDGIIGRGAFGSVVTGYDKEQQHYALKMISKNTSSDDSSTLNSEHKKKCIGMAIRLLLEPIIMMSIRHPHLMSAEHVISNSNSMTIVMKRALGTPWCREVMEFSKLQTLSIQLISAISTLHHHHIIHGDVKPANILLLADNHIALTDFGMSIIKEHSDEDFSHRVGTHTYRAPEAMLKTRWNEKIDSWSLGCTLYEMAYGALLFPSQRDWDAASNLDNDTIKHNANQRGINAVVDWCNLNNYYNSDNGCDEQCKISKNSLLYHPVKLHSKWTDPSMAIFNDLIIKLLHPDYSRRWSITQVLSHPWVTAVTCSIMLPEYGTLHLSPVRKMPDMDMLSNLLMGYFALPTRITADFFSRTAKLYQTVSLDSYDQVLVMLGCGWIIGKLYYHRIFPPSMAEHIIELPEIELAILTNIGYCIDL